MRRVLIFVLVFFVLSQSSCSPPEPFKRHALLMGTFVEIQIVPEGGMRKAYLEDVVESAFGEIRRVERTFSLYERDSELSHLNRLGIGQPYKVSKEFMFLLKKAVFFFKLTEGAFDVSIGSMDRVVIDEANYTVELQEGMRLDFGGMAKGYAVDRAVASLRRYGIKNAIINAGGDMYCLRGGQHKGGWQIGVRDPTKTDAYVATLLVKDRAVATSGEYERPSHIIDPTTGRPVEEALLSATVLAEDCLTADTLATAVFVLGPDKGMELLNRLDDIEGVIVSRDLDGVKIDTSRGLKEIKLSDE